MEIQTLNGVYTLVFSKNTFLFTNFVCAFYYIQLFLSWSTIHARKKGIAFSFVFIKEVKTKTGRYLDLWKS